MRTDEFTAPPGVRGNEAGHSIMTAEPVEHIESIIIAECECCGAERALTRCWLGNMETFACDECRGASDHD